MQTLEEIWNRIEAWLKRYAPDILNDLQPGATEEELAQAEAVLGFDLPEDLKVLYRLHNGSYGNDFLDGWSLLSVEELVLTWQMGQGGRREGWDAPPVGPIRHGSWYPLWLPFMGDGCGDYLCLDLAPGPGGDVGQIIGQSKDSDGWGPFAPNLYWYLAFFATELEDGDYHLDVFGHPASHDHLSTTRAGWLSPSAAATPISQSDLIARVASRTGASIEDAALVVSALLETIRETLVRGEELRLVGFGSFSMMMPEDTAINPATGETALAPARRQVRFSGGDDLQRALNTPAGR